MNHFIINGCDVYTSQSREKCDRPEYYSNEFRATIKQKYNVKVLLECISEINKIKTQVQKLCRYNSLATEKIKKDHTTNQLQNIHNTVTQLMAKMVVLDQPQCSFEPFVEVKYEK